ncbi:MAG: TetR/AcrR family transcriptional regulator [Planctomycetes bacterium]|nr:TetR/AcrR family transcriptional regulator [Planctomycetota bacterium]
MNTQTRKPTTERREQIVQAVLHIIGDKGIAALSTGRLAREVGVTTGALFRHFATREAILQEVVLYAVARIEETFPDASLPPARRLQQLALNRVELLGNNPGLAWLLRSEQAYLSLPRDSTALLRDVVKRSRRYLLEAIREGVERGDIRADIEPEVLLVPILGTIHALVGMPGVHRAAARRSDTDRILEALLQMLAPPTTGRKRN